MLRVDEVAFSYSGQAGRKALDGVTLSVEPGELVALVGCNGSGKSTLAKLTNALLLPDAGRVTVDGMDTFDPAVTFDIRTRVGLVFQHPDNQIVATSVEDDVAFGPENLGLDRVEIRTRVDRALDATGLDGLERREPHLLSGGQKQRLAIAGVLAMEPSYLVLDEPFSMIDAAGRAEVGQVLDALRSGHGILLITHDIEAALRADRIMVLNAGRTAFEGTPGDLLGRQDDFPAWGLESPPLVRLAAALRVRGADVPLSAIEGPEIVRCICPS